MNRNSTRRPPGAESPQLRLLGEPAVVDATGNVLALERKAAAVLAYLVLNGPSGREALARLLWPSTTHTERSRANLRQCLLRIRRVHDGLIDTHGTTLSWSNSLPVDALNAASDSDHPHAQLLGSLDFEDCPRFKSWLERERATLIAQSRTAWLQAAQREYDAGRFDAAIGLVEHAIAADPVAEEPYRRLMQWHYLRADVAAALATWDRCVDTLRRTYRLKVSAETQQLGRAIHAAAGALRPERPALAIPLTLLHPPRSVGRAAALQTLRRAWQSGQIFIVEGEAGMGKTRLLMEFAVTDPNRPLCSARPADRVEPYATLARLTDLLQQRFHTEPLDVESDRWRLASMLEAQLRSCLAQGLEGLILDDLQFADGASLHLLARVLDALHGEQLRIGIGTRSSGLGPEARDFLQQLRSQRELARVELVPLAADEVSQLLDALLIDGLDAATWTPALLQHTTGNPGFLLESLKFLYLEQQLDQLPAELPVPPSVSSAIDWRLQQLSAGALNLAHLKAIAGEDFSSGMAAQILGQSLLDLAPCFAELERVQVLSGARFTHDLVQDAVFRSVPPAIQSYLHGTVAAELERAGGPPARIATHWAGAGRSDLAGPRWLEAAQLAAAASQPLVEVELLERAILCFEETADRAQEFTARYGITLVESHPEYGARVPLHLERMKALANGEQQQLSLQLAAAVWTINQGMYTQSEIHSRAALALSRLLAQPAAEAGARARLAWALVYLGRPQEALRTLIEAGAESSASADVEQRALYYQTLAMAYSGCGQLLKAIAAAEKSADAAQQAGHLGRAFDGVLTVGVMHAWHGNAGEAERWLRDALARRLRLGPVRGVGMAAEAQLGFVLRELGRYDEALPLLGAALTDFRRGNLPAWVTKVENDIAELWLLRDHPQRAAETLTPMVEGLAPTAIAGRLLTSARVQRAQGVDHRATLQQAASLLDGTTNVRAALPIAIEAARDLPAAEAWQRLTELCEQSAAAELMGVALNAASHALQIAMEADGSDRARTAATALALRVLPWLEDYAPSLQDRNALLVLLARALGERQSALAARLIEESRGSRS